LNNNIVLIVPKDSTWNISSFNDIANVPGKTLAIGAPESVPAGAYAKEAIVQFADVQQVATTVATGNADVGVVYSTNALANDKVKVVATGPDAVNAKIVYPAAKIKESKNQDVTQKYLDFLFSNEAKAIFENTALLLLLNRK
jgi:molybdate transport system substrate-binding protein